MTASSVSWPLCKLRSRSLQNANMFVCKFLGGQEVAKYPCFMLSSPNAAAEGGACRLSGIPLSSCFVRGVTPKVRVILGSSQSSSSTPISCHASARRSAFSGTLISEERHSSLHLHTTCFEQSRPEHVANTTYVTFYLPTNLRHVPKLKPKRASEVSTSNAGPIQ